MKYVLIAFLLALSFTAHAALHKWVDSEGKVHYSDEPPPPDVKSQTIRTAPESPAEASAPAAAGASASGPAPAKTIYEKEAEMKKAQKAKAEASQKAAQKEQEAQLKQKNCEQSRNQLATLQNSPRIATYDASGERSFMDDTQRQRAIDDAQAAIKQYCQ
jgi:hypothetical protein